MALTSGFNPTLVTTAIGGVKKSQASLMRTIVDGVNNQFISPMSNAWACKEAQDFFKEFKTSMDDLVTKADSTFQSVVDTMNQGGVNWANETGNSGAFAKVPYTNYTGRISVDSIKENIGDVRGVDPAAARTAIAAFSALSMNADAALSTAVNAVANSGFLGGDQQANLTASLNSIKKDVKETFDSYTNQTKDYIEKAIEKYGEMESKTSETFNVSGGGAGQAKP